MTCVELTEGQIREADPRNGAHLRQHDYRTTNHNDGEIDMMLDSTPTASIRALELSYTERVNMAVAEDRYDLVAELAAEYEVELRAAPRAA